MAYFEFDPHERLRSNWSPVIDVLERGKEFVVRVELAGVAKDQVRLRWRDGVLTISGTKRRQATEQETSRYLCMERAHGHFRRDIAINRAIDFEKSTATLTDGLLTIRLPKRIGREKDSYIPIE